MNWAGLVLGVIAAYWPVFGLLRMKSLKQSELANLDDKKYHAINIQSFSHGLASVFIAFVSVAGLISLTIQKPTTASQLIPIAFMAGVAILGLMDALFALRKGVYPAVRYWGAHTTYTFDEGGAIRQMARLHLLSTSACLGIGLAYWLVTWLLS